MADYVPLPYSAIIELDRQAIQNGLTASSFLIALRLFGNPM